MRRFQGTATVQVPLAVEEAMELFTARGERSWVPGWTPEFPAGEPPPDAREDEGTVFVTDASARPTFWVVATRWREGIRYARITPGSARGRSRCEAAAQGRTPSRSR